MLLSELKQNLKELKTISFQLPNGDLVPRNFHVTEVGKVSKTFIDCGGTLRKEDSISLQLWNADDYDHRLYPDKLLSILELSENTLDLQNLEIEVEYQGESIQKYGLDFDGKSFLLTTTQTDCLAKESCGIPNEKEQVSSGNQSASCEPGSGCC
jgi:hypothetical protein